MTVFDLATPARGEHHLIGRVRWTVRMLWRWSVARSRAGELDALIAHGDRVAAPELCEARGRQLVKVHRRAAVAAQIETCVEAATDPRGSWRRTSAWHVDLRDRAVSAAAAELLDLAHALRAAQRVEPRGVAMATLLVRDGQSSLYVARDTDDVAKAANAARAALSARSSD
jgi:hypothetical protein